MLAEREITERSGRWSGAGGIRTPGSRERPAAFKAAAINRTLPPLQAGTPPAGSPTGARADTLLSGTRNRLRPGYTASRTHRAARAEHRTRASWTGSGAGPPGPCPGPGHLALGYPMVL